MFPNQDHTSVGYFFPNCTSSAQRQHLPTSPFLHLPILPSIPPSLCSSIHFIHPLVSSILQGSVPFNISRLFKWQSTNVLTTQDDSTEGGNNLTFFSLSLSLNLLTLFIFPPHFSHRNHSLLSFSFLPRYLRHPPLLLCPPGRPVCTYRTPHLLLLPPARAALLRLRKLCRCQTHRTLKHNKEASGIYIPPVNHDVKSVFLR